MNLSIEDVMMPVLIKEFLSAKTVPVDIFIKMPGGKFVQLFKAGDELQLERLRSYQEKNIEDLYVKKSAYGPYVQQHIQIAGTLLNRKDIDNRTKSAVVGRMTAAVFKEMEGMGFSRESFDRARTITRTTMDLVESKLSLSQLIESLVATRDDIAGHSMAVSVMSVMIAQGLGWEQDTNIEKIALGGLLHDIGKKELPRELLTKPRALMTPEEIVAYESHPYRGVLILNSLGVVHDDVIRIVYEHHERGPGHGYPRRLPSPRTHPLAKVVGLANEFINLTVKNPNFPAVKQPKEAVSYIENVLGQPFEKEAFKVLKDLVENFGKATTAA